MEERARVQAALVGLLGALPAPSQDGHSQAPMIIIQGDVNIGELRVELGRVVCKDAEPAPAH
jgi:hypothetical protein